MSKPEPAQSNRTPAQPRLTIRPIVRMRHRRYPSVYGAAESSTRWYLFGVVLIWARRDGGLRLMQQLKRWLTFDPYPCPDCKPGAMCPDCFAAHQW